MTSKLALVLKVAASGVAMAGVLGACKPAAFGQRPLSAAAIADPQERVAATQAEKALRAMREQDLATAIGAAEMAVAAAPADAGYRLMLANAYLGAGRFLSARQSYEDAAMLAPGLNRAQIGVALASLGTGDAARARAALAELGAGAPAADQGLALALAGDADKAIALLEAEARSPLVTARTRQNLALAHALAGDWPRARAVAAQDLSGATLDARLAQWAALAGESRSELRVASILSVIPDYQDAGRPVALALVQPPSAPVVAPEPRAVFVDAGPAPLLAPAALAVSEPATVVTADVALDAPRAPVADVVPFATPAVAPAPLVNRSPALALGRTMEAQLRRVSAGESHALASGWVIQLGAYSSEQRVNLGWANATGRFGRLASYTPTRSTIRIGGRTLHRLGVIGPDSRSDANALCISYRTQGGDCFVRGTSGDSPVRIAGLGSKAGA